MDIKDIASYSESFRYQLLDRMRGDCSYYLGYGNKSAKHLWALNVTEQIAFMKALWHSFSEFQKPEWLTLPQIIEFEKQMTA